MNPHLRDELAAMIAEEIGATTPSMPADMRARMTWFEFNDSVLNMELEQTERARTIRRIAMIADRYGWARAVSSVLDREGVMRMEDLKPDVLVELLATMERHVDRAMTCCDDDDAFPAR